MKKKVDFSKRLVFVVLLWSLLCVTVSYVFTFLDKSANEAVTSNILLYVTAPTVTAYLATKTVEKASRNKYGLDENGQPLKQDDNTPVGYGKENENELEQRST